MPKISEARRSERREQILAGARRAFARHGYEGATVAHLEQETGLSRGAIFNYFPDKWAIFYALAELDHARIGTVWLEEGFAAVLRLMTSENADWLGVYFELSRKLRTNPKLREQWERRNPELDERLMARFEELQAQGELRADLPAETVGRFLGIVLDGVGVAVSAGYPVDAEPLLDLVNAATAPQ
jgi:TetR/AcrR family transcriptional regulator, transcriptional repressor of aconitase